MWLTIDHFVESPVHLLQAEDGEMQFPPEDINGQASESDIPVFGGEHVGGSSGSAGPNSDLSSRAANIQEQALEHSLQEHGRFWNSVAVAVE